MCSAIAHVCFGPKADIELDHSINSSAREFIQGSILRAYQDELVRSRQPGYICRYDEIDAGEVGTYEFAEGPAAARSGETPGTRPLRAR